MNDLISRQAAIATAISGRVRTLPTTEDGEDWIRVNEVRESLLNLPTASPRWIPVTERLPKIDMSYPHHEDYLVQYDSGDMDVASWSNVNRFWADHVTEPYWNCVQFAKVIAYMPLPKPWKGEDE